MSCLHIYVSVYKTHTTTNLVNVEKCHFVLSTTILQGSLAPGLNVARAQQGQCTSHISRLVGQLQWSHYIEDRESDRQRSYRHFVEERERKKER